MVEPQCDKSIGSSGPNFEATATGMRTSEMSLIAQIGTNVKFNHALSALSATEGLLIGQVH